MQISKSITPHPPKGTEVWRIGPKAYKNQEKCQNPAPRSPESKKSNIPEFLRHAVNLGHETTIFGFRISKCIHSLSSTPQYVGAPAWGNTYELVSQMPANSSPKTLQRQKVRSWYQKYGHPPPPNPYISETAVSHRFQKVYTHPPPRERYFGASDQKFKNPRKKAKTHRVGAQ